MVDTADVLDGTTRPQLRDALRLHNRVQVRNPVTGRYVKIDSRTGRITDEKKSPGPYKGIADLTPKK